MTSSFTIATLTLTENAWILDGKQHPKNVWLSMVVKIPLVHICSLSIFLFHFRYKDWETKDALLYCLSSEKLKSDLKEVPEVLVNLVITNLEYESSFVKKAAIKFLSKLWQIQPDCWPEFQYLNSSWKCFNSIQGNVWSY